MELQIDQKINALISLSNHAYDETKRYRDHVWKMVVWTIGLIVAVIAASETTQNLFATCYGKSLGIVFIVIVAACGAWDIYFDYTQFVWNRNILRDCERRLQLFDKDAYGEGTVLPEGWKTADYEFKQCLPHYLQWMFVIATVTGYAIYKLICVS